MKESACMDIAIGVALICAGLLPLFWSKSRDETCKNKEVFLLGTCILNVIVVFVLVLASTY